jgi:hypothetical protein
VHGLCTCTGEMFSRREKCVERSQGDIFALFIPKLKSLVSVRPGYLCHLEDICIGDSKCQNGVCTCEKGLVVLNDKCTNAPNGRYTVLVFSFLTHNGQCSKNNRIFLDAKICDLFICLFGIALYTINYSFTLFYFGWSWVAFCTAIALNISIQCLCLANPGEPCSHGETCIGGSVCINFVCSCTSGLVKRDDQCLTPSPGTVEYRLLSSPNILFDSQPPPE